MQRTWSKGVEIAFDDVGKGEPVIVLIHGSFGNRSYYSGVASRLSDHHRVISVDLRGHGDSGVPETGYLLDDFATDVIAVCREAGVDRAVLVGHSAMGNVAMLAAAREPSLAAGVVMLDGAVLMPDALRAETIKSFIPLLEGPDWLDALRGFFSNLMFGPFDPPEVKERIMRDLDTAPAQIAGPLWRDIFRGDFAEELETTRCPLLYIHAQIPSELDRLRALRPDAIVVSVVASGHFMMLVVPEQVAAMIDRFVEVLPIAAAAYA